MIPLLVHHVWPGVDPFRYADWRISWMRHHPDASFRFWRDARGLDERVQAVVADDRYTPTVKSDVLRWAVLVEAGGIYTDGDMECLAPLTSFLNDPKECFLAKEDDTYVCATLIAAAPQHPFVRRALDAVLTSLASVSPEEANANPNVVTGPHLLTRLVNNQVTIHSYHRFYPIHYGGRAPAPLENAVTNHHWKAEWKKQGPGWRTASPQVPSVSASPPPFLVAVTHAAYRPERVACLERMRELLPNTPLVVFESKTPEPCSVWARRLWTWMAEQTRPVLVLQDDINLAPNFLAAVTALIKSAPGNFLNLHEQGPDVKRQADRGERWTASHYPTGPAYIVPNARVARSWLTLWDDNKILREDELIALWLQRSKTIAYGCLPALVQHRVDIPSTIGNDTSPHRQTSVPWTDFPSVNLLEWPPPVSRSPLLVCHSAHERCGIREYGRQLDASLSRYMPVNAFSYQNIRAVPRDTIVLVHYEPSLTPAGFVDTVRAWKNQGARIVFCCHWYEPEAMRAYEGLVDSFVTHKPHPNTTEIHLGCPTYTPGNRDALRARFGFNPNDVVVTTLGFLSRWKKIPETIEALLARNTQLIFCVQTPHPYTGIDSEEEARVRAIATTNVRFSTKFLPERELLDLVHASDLGFLFHGQHTSSVSAATKQFVSARCPLVVTKSSHNTDLREGVVRVPGFDVSAFAQVVVDVAQDAGRREALRKGMLAEYARLNMDAVAERYLELFEGLPKHVPLPPPSPEPPPPPPPPTPPVRRRPPLRRVYGGINGRRG
jgi:glycosyltransferase involved in cell wall biosynthesis